MRIWARQITQSTECSSASVGTRLDPQHLQQAGIFQNVHTGEQQSVVGSSHQWGQCERNKHHEPSKSSRNTETETEGRGVREAKRPHRETQGDRKRPQETQGDRKAISTEHEHRGIVGWGSVLALPGPHWIQINLLFGRFCLVPWLYQYQPPKVCLCRSLHDSVLRVSTSTWLFFPCISATFAFPLWVWELPGIWSSRLMNGYWVWNSESLLMDFRSGWWLRPLTIFI